jgi:hypothetical protein
VISDASNGFPASKDDRAACKTAALPSVEAEIPILNKKRDSDELIFYNPFEKSFPQ